MKTTISILLCLIIVNCTLQVPIEEPDKQIGKETVMNNFIVKIDPYVEEYSAFYQSGNTVFGIPLNAKGPGDLVKIDPIVEIEKKDYLVKFEQFFVFEKKPYFAIKQTFPGAVSGDPPIIITKYCSMENGDVVEMEEIDFPSTPEQVRVTGDTGTHQIDIGSYNESPVSILTRFHKEKVDYVETLIFVDGFLLIEGGLLIHAKEGRGAARPNGLLFWPDNIVKDGNITRSMRTMDHWKGPGRFWK